MAPPRPPSLQDRQLGAQVLCAFWDPKEQLWATEGCWQVPPQPGTPLDPRSTTCTCSHLTSFAVLMAFRELEVGTPKPP